METNNRLAAAQSSKTTIKALRFLADDIRREVKLAALCNPKLPSAWVEDKCRFQESVPMVINVIRNRQDLSEAFLSAKLITPTPELEEAVLAHPNCPQWATNALLAQSKLRTGLLCAIAKNKALTPEQRAALIKHKDLAALRVLATNPELTPEEITAIYERSENSVPLLETLVSNPKTSVQTLEELTRSEHFSVEISAKRALQGRMSAPEE